MSMCHVVCIYSLVPIQIKSKKEKQNERINRHYYTLYRPKPLSSRLVTMLSIMIGYGKVLDCHVPLTLSRYKLLSTIIYKEMMLNN